jgi:hypothetical protein
LDKEMRKDMSKVVTERPRSRPGKNKDMLRHRKQKIIIDSDGEMNDSIPLIHKTSMKPKYYDRKDFSDLLGPLKKFINSNVGRPWDNVYSEVCESIPANGTLNIHIRNHVSYMVTEAYEEDGIYWDSKGNAIMYPKYIVCNGILLKLPSDRSYLDKVRSIKFDRYNLRKNELTAQS